MAEPHNNGTTEPFPSIDEDAGTSSPPPTSSRKKSPSVTNRPKASSSISNRIRSASQTLNESNPPAGFAAATGDLASSILSSPRGTGDHDVQQSATATSPKVASPKHVGNAVHKTATESSQVSDEPQGAAPYANGYHFPPRHSFGQSTALGLKAFWKYFTTPLGFLVTIYGLNVVAWGGMLFLLLCNASPAMCQPTCNDIDSPRRKWIEWDSQILNALFCVTGFGLAPWRFRDLWYLLKYRIWKDETGLRRLAGIHRGWFRLPGSSRLPVDIGSQTISSYPAIDESCIPYPREKISDAPLTGVRANDTPVWKLDLVIWLMVWNTIFQVLLCVFMWGWNRYDRPSWSTGLFVAIACIVAGVGGYIMFLEGKKVKSKEGVPVSDKDMRRLEEDREKGVYHYNNIKGKDLEAKKAAKAERKAAKRAAKTG